MAQGDSSKATAQGPGLEPLGNIANKSTYFDVYTAGKENLNVASQGLFLITVASVTTQQEMERSKDLHVILP